MGVKDWDHNFVNSDCLIIRLSTNYDQLTSNNSWRKGGRKRGGEGKEEEMALCHVLKGVFRVHKKLRTSVSDIWFPVDFRVVLLSIHKEVQVILAAIRRNLFINL